MKLKELIIIWEEYKKNFVKRSSMSAYGCLIYNHILPHFGDNEIIEEDQVQIFVLNKIQGGLSQKTVKDVLIVLKMILKFGKKRKLFPFEEWEIDYPSEDIKPQKEVLNNAESKKLVKYLNENFSFKNLGILIAVSTGMRIGEISGLRWADIDLDHNMITVGRTIQRIYTRNKEGKLVTEVIVQSPKTKTSNRQIPMSPDLIKIIKPLFKILPNKEYYILQNSEKPLEPRLLRVYYMALMQSLGLPPINFHGLRHSFATRCINANIDIKTVSVILGHSNITTTLNAYSHPNMEQKKSAISKMFKAMN